MTLYGYDGSGLTEGARVELHPATSLWMQGVRYGQIVRINERRGVVRVALDGFTRNWTSVPSLLRVID